MDTDALGRAGADVLAFTAAVAAARPFALQLRAKSLSPRDTLALGREMARVARAHDVDFYLNDRPDLALLAGADGVHVGQTDLTVREVRQVAPGLRVGASTHGTEELQLALAERPDYVAFGPVFPTRSKHAPDPVVGLRDLGQASAAAKAAGVPLVAIGGIDLSGAAQVAELAVAGAVIAGLGTDVAGAEQRAGALHRALGGAT